MRSGWALGILAGLLTAYLAFAMLLGERVLGVEVRLRHVYLAALAVVLVVVAVPRVWRRLPDGAIHKAALLAGSTLLSLLAVDTVMSWRANREPLAILEEEMRDPTTGFRDLLVPRFYPTEARFQIYKPSFRMSAERYGDLYSSNYLRSPTLVQHVLERRRVSIAIGADGFRATSPLSAARIVALGDSYTDGPTITQEQTWPEVLAALLGQPVYNLGIDGTSPLHEYLLLEYLVRVRRVPVRQVLWMIFEGNDLDDLDAEYGRSRDRPSGAIDETEFGLLTATLPRMIRAQSVLGQLRRGELRLAGRGTPDRGVWQVDGVRLATPLYRSDRLGAFLVYWPYLDRATQPRAYVLDHPNRRLLDAVFADMKRLAAAHGFDVTVIVAPSLPRLYAAELPGAGISETPHLIEYVAQLAAGLGFRTVNLYEEMRPYAARELLYFRDDTHWNARGNRVVAEVIARHVFGR